MHTPKGIEKFCSQDLALLLLKTLQGLKQAAFEHWRVLLQAMRAFGMTRKKADPCVHFKWTNNGLILWRSWVADPPSCGNEQDVMSGKETLKQCLNLDEVGELNECIGCKVECNKEEGWMKSTQPVLMQSFQDAKTTTQNTGRTGINAHQR